MKQESHAGAPKGNQNAAKDETLDDQTTFRHTKEERAAWMEAKGKDGKLTVWMRNALNAAAGFSK